MGKKSTKSNTALQKFGLSILTVFIVGAIVFSTYYFTLINTLNKEDSKYIDELYKFKVEVDKSNDLVATAVNGIDNLDIKNKTEITSIKDTIASASTNLKHVTEKIDLLRPPAKYEDQYAAFARGIYLNRLIFSQSNLIIKNTKSSPQMRESAIKSLSVNILETSKNYEASKLKKASIKLPQGILQMSDKVGSYALNVYNDYENKVQNLEQYTSYFKTMNDLVARLNASKEDLNIYLNFIKANTLGMEDVYVKIESKLSDLTDIETDYTALAVPPKMGTRHSQFDEILKSYMNYCTDYKEVLTSYEAAGSDPAAQSTVTAAFDDLLAKYNVISKNCTNYSISLNNDKDIYSNTDNL